MTLGTAKKMLTLFNRLDGLKRHLPEADRDMYPALSMAMGVLLPLTRSALGIVRAWHEERNRKWQAEQGARNVKAKSG